MKKEHVALLIAGFSIVGLSLANEALIHKYNNLVAKTNNLRNWALVAQRVMIETHEKHPEVIDDFSNDLLTDIDFYAIMDSNNLA